MPDEMTKTENSTITLGQDFNGSWKRPYSWLTDIIPSWHAGPGVPFRITGAWTDTLSGSVNVWVGLK